MKVYVVRHGQSESNKAKQWTGWLDAPLTDKGREDAERAGALMKGVSFDRVFASDLVRATETARIVLPSAVFQTSPLLGEINVGDIAGKPLDVLTEAERAYIRVNGYVGFNGESQETFRGRVRTFMDELASLRCENAAIFTHAGWLRAMLDAVIGTYIPRNKLCCHNCTVAVFEYADGQWRLYSWINVI